VSGTKCYLCLGPLKGSERTSFLSMTRVCVLFADFDGGASLVPATARSALSIAGCLLKSLSWRLAKLQSRYSDYFGRRLRKRNVIDYDDVVIATRNRSKGDCDQSEGIREYARAVDYQESSVAQGIGHSPDHLQLFGCLTNCKVVKRYAGGYSH